MADDSQRIKYVYADSTNRDVALYPSGNSYTLHLTNPVHSVIQVDLVAAKVPNTMYNILDGSNVITFSNTSVTSNVSISPGYYSAFGLAQALANASGFLFAVDFLTDEGKFLVSSNLASFTVQGNTAEFRKAFGIDPGVHSSFAASSSPIYAMDLNYGCRSLYKTTKIADLAINEYVFLDIEELRTTSVLDGKKLINGTTEGTSIRTTFGMVPMDVPGGGIKNYKETTDYNQYVIFTTPIPKIQRLTIRWTDHRNQLLNFQGFENNAFTLRFHCEYREPPPPPPPLQDVQIQRIVDALTHAPPPPKPPPEKRAFGRWVIIVIILLLVLMYIAYVRIIQPLQERLLAPPPPPPPVQAPMKLY